MGKGKDRKKRGKNGQHFNTHVASPLPFVFATLAIGISLIPLRASLPSEIRFQGCFVFRSLFIKQRAKNMMISHQMYSKIIVLHFTHRNRERHQNKSRKKINTCINQSIHQSKHKICTFNQILDLVLGREIPSQASRVLV